MKKHCAKVARIGVVDYSAAKKDLEDQIEDPLGEWIWEFDNQKKPGKREIEAMRRDSQKALDRLRVLEENARQQPLFYASAQGIPLFSPTNLDWRGDSYYFLFHDYVYEVSGPYTEGEFRLLVLDEFDRERRMFERLHSIHVAGMESLPSAQRERIPERTRMFVWRRDGGKCVRCGGRDGIEFDHIVPVSKGGGNTARNIELLCESCNREKSDQIR